MSSITLPSHLDEAARAEALQHIVELNTRIGNAAAEHAVKQADAKQAKERVEGLYTELRNYIDELSKPLPLFDKKKGEQAPAKALDDEAWRGVPIETLVSHGLPQSLVVRLGEASLTTIGLLADFTNAGKRLTDLDGVGEAKAEKIEQALERFWSEWKAPEPESEPEPAAESEGAVIDPDFDVVDNEDVEDFDDAEPEHAA
jgi:hypothetical protein